MKVLLVADNFKKGGKERQMLELLRGLRAEPGITAEVLVLGDTIAYPDLYELADEVHRMERLVKKDPLMFFKVFRFLKARRPDLVHSWGVMGSTYLIPGLKVMGIPLINGIIRDAPVWKHAFEKRLVQAKLTFPFSDIILGNSQAGLKSFGAPTRRGRVILNGIDTNRSGQLASPEAVRERFGISTRWVVGMVGGFNYRKDYPTYFQAAGQLLDQGLDVTFLAVGGGYDFERVKALVPGQHRSGILFTGQQDDVESIVNMFDLGVLVTNADLHMEGISNSIMEYMLLGKPVVATDGGGTPEIVLHEETGYVIPPYDAAALAEKIRYLLEHPAEAQSMGRRGRERIETHFALDTMVRSYLEIYRELVPEAEKPRAKPAERT